MIVLATTLDEKNRVIVSHGIDADTMRNVILPCETLDYFKRHCNAKYSSALGEWVMDEKFDSECI